MSRRRHFGAENIEPTPVSLAKGHFDSWWRAVALCDEWRTHAMATGPADRSAAEAAISTLYRRAGAEPPVFIWVDSPRAALDLVPPGPIRSFYDYPRGVANDIADRLTGLRWRSARWDSSVWWGARPPQDALELLSTGSSPFTVARSHLLRPLGDLVRGRIAGYVRAELGDTVGLCWYGQQEADWLAWFSVLEVLRERAVHPEVMAGLEPWAVLARSCGWWWPRNGRCVISERPTAIHVDAGGEPLPHNAFGPAIEYADGFAVYAWHGTRVPAWVIDDPTPDRIAAERNAEVRRCAVENLGWQDFLDGGGLTLVATAPDPGNAGNLLSLYDQPVHWGRNQRLLVAVNGSVERDGTRRRYGLRVPGWFDDPVDAAAWTYGLTGDQYALLLRRT
ncbi:hypothetical protein GCM10022243_36630 [Saccharothrix violaceirubra]|uniref:DUF6745 domain-containing protein n=1 Tax=Saccharothrix violaceirubra TaxID=413306 RepID=A0A7W7WWT4_9PSEU|nr:hypothetical protein [Saccharothrix violaceirubra]MBB4966421.1 hypothetical protein [Saccharothrix violaceirubra]